MRRGISSPKTEVAQKKDPGLIEHLMKYSTDEACREYLEKRQWPNGPVCPRCNSTKAYKLKGKSTRPGVYKCGGCRKPYTVTIGTFLEGTHISLVKWFAALYLMTSNKKGVSAHYVHRQLGVCYETAWFMCHRIRNSWRHWKKEKTMRGIIEVDETFVGGKKKPWKPGRGSVGKAPVIGLVQRGKNVRAIPIPDVKKPTLQEIIQQNVYNRSKVMTDDWTGYIGLNKRFEHHKVKHKEKEYARREGPLNVHTNTIEGYFSLLKRSIFGTFHHVSPEKLGLYCDELSFKYNHRHIKDAARFDRAFDKIDGRLTWYFKKRPVGVPDGS